MHNINAEVIIMLNLILDTVLLFLIFYALVCITIKITDYILKKEETSISHALVTPKFDDSLEFNLRRAAARCNRLSIPLFIINKNIDEKSLFIIYALKEEFPFISLISIEEYSEKYL